MTPRHVRTITTGAVASVALAVTGTAVFSPASAPSASSRIERSAVSESPTTVSPDAGTVAGQRGQSVSAGLRDKALRTAVLTDIPPSALAAYQRAASSLASADAGCHLPWTVLAAVGQVESDHGRTTSRNARGIVGVPLDGKGVKAVADTDAGTLDGDTKHDRAVGPMQILPSTWASVAVDGDGDGKRDPQDIDDAALGAAVYLCGSGADLGTPAGQEKALRTYNNSASYVTLVMSVARSYGKDEKAQYAVGSLQTGGVDLSDVGTTYSGTDTKPAKKAKVGKKKAATKTKSATPATKTPSPAKTPAPGKGPKPGTPTPKPGTPTPTTTPGGGTTPAPGGDTNTPPAPVTTTYDMVMPDVVSALTSQTDAESAINQAAAAGKNADKHVGAVTVSYAYAYAFSDTVPEGDVISTDPVATTSVTSSAVTVTLTISKGQDPAAPSTSTSTPSAD